MQLRIVAAFLALAVLFGAAPVAQAAPPVTGGVMGKVTHNGAPVAGAAVHAAGQTARSGRDGVFRFPRFAVSGYYRLTNVVVQARGYGRWELRDAQIRADDTLELTVDLQKTAVNLKQPAVKTRDTAPTIANQPELAGPSAPTALKSQTRPPSTIRVLITGDWRCNTNASGYVRHVDFNYYVKHVLPNEWLPGWHRNSLRAGAMAVKSYAWYYWSRGGKWPSRGADVMDSTCDQVYNPAVSYTSTNGAVDNTWPYRITRDGKIIPGFYRAGTRGDCSRSTSDIMRQWGSKCWADRGYYWPWILKYYYRGTVVSRMYY